MAHASSLRTGRLLIALLAVTAFAAGCAAGPSGKTAAGGPTPQFLTVPQLNNLLQMGTPLGVIFGKIDGSGTIYRLTTQQEKDLRANGMPASLLSYIEQGYQHAILVNPELAKSDEKWKEIDGYWYGGTPAGWPRDWVVGAPAPGQLLR
ncbi:MAG TPA: hypothetical protein VMS22_09740 [Candidatus Eisenbacteria bacterium]|nr:hypothetical protein [Candidatus Eisenbacteria bacterium]